jgi:hypothetical protein
VSFITDHYLGKEKDECGKTKSIVNNPCRKSTETFAKFVSNANGDPYVDPGTFNKQLRGSTPQKRPQSAKPFKSAHPGNRSVKNSEFEHKDCNDPKGAYNLTPFVKRPGGFYNKKNSESFTNVIKYTEDPYERKQDMERQEYARLNSKVMYKN